MHELKPSYFFDSLTPIFLKLFNDREYVFSVLGKPLHAFILEHVKNEIKGNVSPLAVIDPVFPVFIDEGTTVEPFAYIRGPAIIGKNCEIRQGAYIRGDVLVGDHCVVGHTTEMKGSVMLDHAKAGHFAYIGDSILGSHVNLGAGTKLANLKLTNSEVFITCSGQKIGTGLRKFGAILGDHTQTGCNSVTSPGTMMGPNSLIYPCVSCRGFHAADSKVVE